MRAISIHNLSFSYPDGRLALKDISFEVKEGERVALLGPNGAGKTTLLLALAGLLKWEGKIEIFGIPVEDKRIKETRKLFGLVFQDPDDQLFMPTVLEDVAFGPLNLGLSEPEALKRAEETLKTLGLSGYENRLAHHLSLGEKRKVAIASILTMEPKIVALDEPTANLDPPGKQMLFNALKSLEVTLIIATHELKFASTLCKRSLIIYEGRLIADQPFETILKDKPLLERSGLISEIDF